MQKNQIQKNIKTLLTTENQSDIINKLSQNSSFSGKTKKDFKKIKKSLDRKKTL